MVHLIRLRHGVRVLATAVILTALTIAAAPAQAQEMQRIAAVVNDEAISFFDVFERVKLVVATSGLDGSPGVIQRITPQVLRALIDEHLRLQEGVRRNIDVSEDEIDRAINTIEQDNRRPSGSFLKFLEENRISVETLETRVRSELVWSKLVNRRVRRSVTISDEDIDNELELMRDNVGKPEYLLSEIFISVDKPSEDKRVRGDATELVAQLRGGADFDSMVNQFSEGVTANRGGGVGWVNAAQLSPNIVSVITTMATGDISDPIATGGGYLIVLLRDRRQSQGAGADDTQVDLRQILLTLPPDSVIRESVSGCDDMVRIAAETDPSLPGDMGIIRIKNTPEPIKVVLRSLPLTTVSQPIRTKRGIHLLMICDKIEVEASLPGRDQIRNSLLINRLGQVSRQYLRDLRRDAFIDIRI